MLPSIRFVNLRFRFLLLEERWREKVPEEYTVNRTLDAGPECRRASILSLAAKRRAVHFEAFVEINSRFS